MKKYKVVSCLELGCFDSLTYKIFYWSVFCVSFIMFFLGFILIPQEGIAIITLSIVSFILILMCLLSIRNEYKKIKLFNKCLKDGVILDAKVKITDKIGYSDTSSIIMRGKARIKTTFIYEDKKITVRSGQRDYNGVFDGSVKAGYCHYYQKLDNKEIKILYSPTYRQVFILKDRG